MWTFLATFQRFNKNHPINYKMLYTTSRNCIKLLWSRNNSGGKYICLTFFVTLVKYSNNIFAQSSGRKYERRKKLVTWPLHCSWLWCKAWASMSIGKHRALIWISFECHAQKELQKPRILAQTEFLLPRLASGIMSGQWRWKL